MSQGASGSPASPRKGESWTVGELLTWTKERFEQVGLESPRVDAEYLLAHALSCSRMDLYLRHEQLVPPEPRAAFREFVRRRLAREPVAYIEGRRGFHALDLELLVDRRVLVPRPDTEHLVDWVLEWLPAPPLPPTHVIDVGTGSGAIACALARTRPDLLVHAVDRSRAALEVAARNIERCGVQVALSASDLLEDVELPPGGFAAVLANLPYIPTAQIEGLAPEVRDYEPREALDGGEEGLDLIARLVRACAPGEGRLAPRGALFLEIGEGQEERVRALLRAAGFSSVEGRRDYGGVLRVLLAQA